MSSPLEVRPIGYVASARTDPANTTGWGEVEARIELTAELGTHALDGLAGFSHAEIVFWFDRITPAPRTRNPPAPAAAPTCH